MRNRKWSVKNLEIARKLETSAGMVQKTKIGSKNMSETKINKNL